MSKRHELSQRPTKSHRIIAQSLSTSLLHSPKTSPSSCADTAVVATSTPPAKPGILDISAGAARISHCPISPDMVRRIMRYCLAAVLTCCRLKQTVRMALRLADAWQARTPSSPAPLGMLPHSMNNDHRIVPRADADARAAVSASRRPCSF